MRILRPTYKQPANQRALGLQGFPRESGGAQQIPPHHAEAHMAGIALHICSRQSSTESLACLCISISSGVFESSWQVNSRTIERDHARSWRGLLNKAEAEFFSDLGINVTSVVASVACAMHNVREEPNSQQHCKGCESVGGVG